MFQCTWLRKIVVKYRSFSSLNVCPNVVTKHKAYNVVFSLGFGSKPQPVQCSLREKEKFIYFQTQEWKT